MSSFHPGFEEHIEALCNTEKGYFVDIGAHDGIDGNNTEYFEKRGWQGVCIEPIPRVFQRLKSNRHCRVENVAVWKEEGEADFWDIEGYPEMLSGIVEAYDPRHVNRIEREIEHFQGKKTLIKVPTRKFENLVDSNKIDFLSIDTEGSELQILETVDFTKFDIRVIAIENNFNDPLFIEFFEKRGYKLDSIFSGCDQVYVKHDS
jgi:FkbM family methyltransferase